MTTPPTDPLRALYEAIAARRATRPTAVRDLPDDERREYLREAKRASRERQREASATGSPLATDDAIRSALARAFPGRGGVPGTVRALPIGGLAADPRILLPASGRILAASSHKCLEMV